MIVSPGATARTLAERLARGRVVRRRISVADTEAPIYVSPDAQLKYLKATFDHDLIRLAENALHADSTVWDVGANVGTFTFAAACIARNGTVVSIEPDAWLTQLLRRTSGLSAYEARDIRVLCAAVSDQVGVAELQIAKRGRACNALVKAGGRSQMGGVRSTQWVPTTTLDSLLECFPEPTFIKIDIEGAEQMAIEGAPKIIHDVRPDIYIEVGPHTQETVYRLLTDAGYVALDTENQRLDSCATNTLFRPRSSCHRPAGVN